MITGGSGAGVTTGGVEGLQSAAYWEAVLESTQDRATEAQLVVHWEATLESAWGPAVQAVALAVPEKFFPVWTAAPDASV